MGREYKLDVIVDDHGGVQKLKELAQAEDEITASAKNADSAVDRLNQRQQDAQNVFGKVRESVQAQRQVLQELPKDFDTIRISADEAAIALDQIGRGGIRQTLNDIAAGAGLTVTELGLLESAGLAVGAAFVGWGIGRAIADFTGLDETIGNSTAALLGWGDVGAAQAAAKADVLARATKNVGYEVTNFTEAVEINTRALAEWKTQAQEIADNHQRLKAPQESAQAIAIWNNELAKVRAAGVLPALTRDLESHSFSLKELADRYRLSVPAVQAFQRELQDAAAHEKDLLKFAEDAQKRLNDHIREGEIRAKAFHAAYIHAMIEGEKHTDQLNTKAEKLLTTMTSLREEALKAELAAQTQLNAQQGRDALGRPILTDPLDKANRALEELHQKAQPGVSQRAQEEIILQKFRDAAGEGTTAIVGMSTAERNAAQQADTLSRTHAGATVAAANLSASFNQSAGVFMASAASFQAATAQASVARTLAGFGQYSQGEAAAIAGGQFIAGAGIQRFDVGGPVTKDGPIFAHGGEFVVPKDGVLVKGSGGGAPIINIDARGAMFEEDRALDRLASKLAVRLGERASKSLR